ncbi:MAG: chorismate synthase [Bacteroidales bacterium]|nr:chorismate synthase [Bacteroidales bacterium]
MSNNTFGKSFRLTTFGESHSTCLGGIIEGFPANQKIDYALLESELERRKSSSTYSTPRIEEDKVVFLSGIENNISLGTPITFLIENKNIKKQDYDKLKTLFRPSHADYTYFSKYGINSSSGGGRASARETVCRVVGGSLAKQFLSQFDINIESEIESIGRYNYITQREEVEEALKQAHEAGDSLGGVIKCTINNVPKGLGEPIFDKLSATLAQAMISIPSAKSFEIGDGLESCKRLGSQDIDHWSQDFTTQTNHSGGIQGGISNGMQVVFSVGFKPIASIGTIRAINPQGEIIEIENKGRHDCCQLFRARVVVEAMAALTIADFIKRAK